ncbi:hypothetical protein ACIQVR_39580 [Streptomyces xanthochromogenes]|uniref:hypothetical protein n=1 Tax=Streptomyces xanthochromogenes TaxID=67384 RepID=UPI0037F2B910
MSTSTRTRTVVGLLTFVTACTTAYMAAHLAGAAGGNGFVATATAITVFVFTRHILTSLNARTAHRRHPRR